MAEPMACLLTSWMRGLGLFCRDSKAGPLGQSSSALCHTADGSYHISELRCAQTM